MKKNKNSNIKKPFYKKWWFITLAIIVILSFLVEDDTEQTPSSDAQEETSKESTNSDVKEESSEESIEIAEESSKETIEVVQESNVILTWDDKLAEILASEDSKSTMIDSVVRFARDDFDKNEENVDEALNYIIKEYQSGTYLNNINDDSYTLTNVFKSNVVSYYYMEPENLAADSLGEVKESLAFDFFQNVKYVYREVDTPESPATLENETQIEKSLNELGF